MHPNQWQQRVSQRTFTNYLRFQRDFDAQLKRNLLDAISEADRLIAQLPKISFSDRVRLGQITEYRAGLNKVMDDLWGTVGQEVQGNLVDASDLAISGNEQMLAVLLRNGEAQTATRLLTQFRAATERSALNVQSRLINDIKLSTKVYDNRQLSRGMVDRVIHNAIALGKSARELAKDAESLIRPDTPGGVSFAAERLGRTELNNAFHTTQTMLYSEQPWVSGVKWELSDSHPREDECDDFAVNDEGLGEGVFDKDNVPGKPHPQCLCFITAITIPRTDFLDNLVSGLYDDFINNN